MMAPLLGAIITAKDSGASYPAPGASLEIFGRSDESLKRQAIALREPQDEREDQAVRPEALEPRRDQAVRGEALEPRRDQAVRGEALEP